MDIRKYRKEIVFILDLFIIFVVSTTLFHILPESNGTGDNKLIALLPNLLLFIFCWTATQFFFKTYDSLWRYAQSKEYLMLFLGGISAYLLYEILELLMLESKVSVLFTLAAYSIAFLCMLFLRMSYRQYRRRRKSKKTSNLIPIAILGAGDTGVKLLEEIQRNPVSRYHIVYFIDDSIEKIGKRIQDVQVRGPLKELEEIIRNYHVKEIVIAIPSLSKQKRKELFDICTLAKCHVRILPDTFSMLEKEKNHLWNSVRDIKIEELLGREQVSLDSEEVELFFAPKGNHGYRWRRFHRFRVM